MIEFVLAAALMLRDPPGDAVGAGGLVPPSAEQYRNVGSFDLLEVQILESSMLALTIEMAALPNPAGLANGFSNAVIDVYVDQDEGGTEALLPGPEMRMPPGRGWEIALRITGDGATAYRSEDDAAESGTSVSYPVRVQAEERVIRVETPFERGEIDGVYVVTGVYDPFVASGWRPVAETPSPWAFASNEPRRPVIDLLAPDEVAQAEAIRSGVLPTPRNRTAGAMWMLLMAVGVLVAGVGLVLRRMVAPGTLEADAARGDRSEGDSTAPGTEPTPEARPELMPEPVRDATPEPTPVATEGGAGEPSTDEIAAAPSATVALPTFLPALPPAPPEHDASEVLDRPEAGELPERAKQAGPSETSSMDARSNDAFGEPGSWFEAEEDPEARTWRGEGPEATDAAAADPGPEPEPDQMEGGDEPESGDAANAPDRRQRET